jgi:hypothetical protein
MFANPPNGQNDWAQDSRDANRPKGPMETWRLPREAFRKKLEAGSSAAYKVAYEIGRVLAERMAKTDESIANIVAQLEDAETDRDFDVFRDMLIREWSF